MRYRARVIDPRAVDQQIEFDVVTETAFLAEAVQSLRLQARQVMQEQDDPCCVVAELKGYWRNIVTYDGSDAQHHLMHCYGL